MNTSKQDGPDEGQYDGGESDKSKADQGQDGDTEEYNGEGTGEDESQAQGLKADVAAKLKQV